MAAHHLAKGLASLGRGNDSMLMHVTPNEVAGLQTVAKSMGGSLTVNPHTGLPEAGFFDFLGSMAPWLVGAALAPETMGGSLAGAAETSTGGALAAQMTPIAAGAATGAAIAGAKGEDPLMGGIMGGMGGWGGSGVGTTLKNMGSAANTAATAAPNIGSVGKDFAAMPTNIGPSFTNPTAAFTGSTGELGVNMGATNLLPASPIVDTAPGLNMYPSSLSATNGGENIVSDVVAPTRSNLMSGISAAANDPSKFIHELGGAGPAAWKLGVPVGMAALSAMQPEPLKMGDKDKYDPNATLNLSGDTGLQLYPYTTKLADGGAVDVPQSSPMAGGIEALYGTKDGTSLQNTPQDGYGIGRLNALYQGGATGYARGGYLDGPGDGMSDSIPATIEGKQPARLADGEFVVPADVVSHLGNGSTKAGSDRLYSMLDRVRKARTGSTKQGRKINPNKLMPS